MRRLNSIAVLLAFLLTLTACGGEKETQSPDGSGEAVTLYDCGRFQVALPTQYTDKLRVETEFPDSDSRWTPLISVYDQASWDGSNGTGGGFIFGLSSLDQAMFEQMIGLDGSGVEIFATDGEFYYVYTYATDVQFSRPTPDGHIDTESEDWKEWEELNKIGPAAREDFLARNNLQSFSMQDFMDHLAVDAGEHVCIRYYPYFVKDGDTRVYYQLLLRQPARQGEGGVWAVDQWLDEWGNQYLYFPDSGKPAAEYFAQLQEECDAGHHLEYRTPSGAAAAFAGDYFGHETTGGSFEEVPEVNYGYIERNCRLSEMTQDLMFGETVDDLELLECVGEATADNWGALGRYQYGSDWFEPLMSAVADAAIGDVQQQRDEAIMSFLLATRDARTDFRTPLEQILRTQAAADPEAFQNAAAAFSEADREILLSVPSGGTRTRWS